MKSVLFQRLCRGFGGCRWSTGVGFAKSWELKGMHAQQRDAGGWHKGRASFCFGVVCLSWFHCHPAVFLWDWICTGCAYVLQGDGSWKHEGPAEGSSFGGRLILIPV